MRALKVVLSAFALCLGGAIAASAHAVLVSAEPPFRAVLRISPLEVRLLFSEALEPVFSRAQVVDRTGQRVDTGRARVDADNPKLLRIPLRQPLAPGLYKVSWRIVSVDTHVTEGDYSFLVVGPPK
jgi:methionine-rich copper-binding protein CopC